jgi:ribosome-associated translation inhibitor RaiA
MATFYFVLGMVTVLVIAEVVAAFFVIKIINSIKSKTQHLEHSFENEIRHLHQRIDHTVYQRIDNAERHIDHEVQDIYRQLDSRLDKLETKLTKQVIKG